MLEFSHHIFQEYLDLINKLEKINWNRNKEIISHSHWVKTFKNWSERDWLIVQLPFNLGYLVFSRNTLNDFVIEYHFGLYLHPIFHKNSSHFYWQVLVESCDTFWVGTWLFQESGSPGMLELFGKDWRLL